jgi:hypothetical protein
LQQLDAWWEQGKTGICIRGPRHSGKTALAYTWMSILVHLIIETTEFQVLRLEGEAFLSGREGIKHVLDEQVREHGMSPGLIYVDYSYEVQQGDYSFNDMIATIFRHPIRHNKRILAVTNQAVSPYEFDVHEINAMALSHVDLSYLTRYGINTNLAYEVHKVVSKYPQLLPDFESLLTTASLNMEENVVYEYLKRVNEAVAKLK